MYILWFRAQGLGSLVRGYSFGISSSLMRVASNTPSGQGMPVARSFLGEI